LISHFDVFSSLYICHLRVLANIDYPLTSLPIKWYKINYSISASSSIHTFCILSSVMMGRCQRGARWNHRCSEKFLFNDCVRRKQALTDSQSQNYGRSDRKRTPPLQLYSYIDGELAFCIQSKKSKALRIIISGAANMSLSGGSSPWLARENTINLNHKSQRWRPAAKIGNNVSISAGS
jgi:hypothetical protein